MSLFSFFKRKSKASDYQHVKPIAVDMHSHVLPGIDDGAENVEQSLQLIRQFIDWGYEKLIMTPHVMEDYYKNTPEIILGRLDLLREAVKKEGLNIALEAAAEYYLDEFFIEKLEKGTPLLTFGKEKYVLFETSFMNASPQLKQAIFLLQSNGYKPVLAHPERYVYLFDKFQELEELTERGVLLQINIASLGGYYSKQSKTVAEKLIDKGLVSFVGTDCHREKHFQPLETARATEYYYKALSLNLRNNSLL